MGKQHPARALSRAGAENGEQRQILISASGAAFQPLNVEDPRRPFPVSIFQFPVLRFQALLGGMHLVDDFLSARLSEVEKA